MHLIVNKCSFYIPDSENKDWFPFDFQVLNELDWKQNAIQSGGSYASGYGHFGFAWVTGCRYTSDTSITVKRKGTAYSYKIGRESDEILNGLTSSSFGTKETSNYINLRTNFLRVGRMFLVSQSSPTITSAKLKFEDDCQLYRVNADTYSRITGIDVSLLTSDLGQPITFYICNSSASNNLTLVNKSVSINGFYTSTNQDIILAPKQFALITLIPKEISGDSYNQFYAEKIEFNQRCGDSTVRPTNAEIGTQFFDATLGKPIWWDGTSWVDSTGTSV